MTVSWQVDKCQEKLADLMTHSLLLLWSAQIDFKRFFPTICQMREAYEHQKFTCVSHPCGHIKLQMNLMEIWCLFTQMKTYEPKNKHWSWCHYVPYCIYTMWRLINANTTPNSLQPSQKEYSSHDGVTTGSNWNRSQINNVCVNYHIYI